MVAFLSRTVDYLSSLNKLKANFEKTGMGTVMTILFVIS